MDTSWGFSVSRRLISRCTSGNFDFCAATMSRLETLSGQIRTCGLPPEVGGAPPGDGGGEEGSGLPPGNCGPPGNEEPLRMTGEAGRDGAEGGAAWAFKTRLRRFPSSSASEYFKE